MSHSVNPDRDSLSDTLLDSFSSSLPSPLPPHHHRLLRCFLSRLDHSTTIVPLPSLFTTSRPQSFTVTNGLCVTSSICAALEAAEHEVLLVSCFWARSRSQQVVADALRKLSRRIVASGKRKRVRVKIGISSVSLFQKLFHTSSSAGYTYPPESWESQLGLPRPEELQGVELTVKSLFFTPFSILHSKFTIVDRRTLYLPSANVSWEIWLEQLSIFTGGIVDSFVSFWSAIWASSPTDLSPIPPPSSSSISFNQNQHLNLLPTLLLPQPHHRNPRFYLSTHAHTPQNTFLLTLLESARESIFITSPNFTCRPFTSAIIAALQRGVNIDLVTGRRMMLLEQLVTTGGTDFTEFALWRLRRRVRSLRPPGRLRLWYFTGPEEGYEDAEGLGEREPDDDDALSMEEEMEKGHRITVLPHVKAVVVDREWTVLGSMNVDRASWWTSQECSVAVLDGEWARKVETGLRHVLEDRVEFVGVGEEEGSVGVAEREGSWGMEEV